MAAKPAAAAAAGAGAGAGAGDDVVQPGGKRKGRYIHLSDKAKRLKCEIAKLKDEYEAKQQQLQEDYEAELDMIRFRPWVKTRLSGEGDNTACTVDVLRSSISGMKRRPLLDESVGDDADDALFLKALEFRPLRRASSPGAKPEDEQAYHFRIIADIISAINDTKLPTVFELVLILQLFVALGGNLNMPLFVFNDATRPMTTSEVLRSGITKIGRAATTLAAWFVHRSSAFLLAVLLAGPSLCIKWNVACAFMDPSTEPLSVVYTTMFEAAWKVLRSVMDDFDLAEFAHLGVRRLLSLAGERGALCVVRFNPIPPDHVKYYLPSAIRPSLAGSEFGAALYRAFENDDASAYRYAGEDSTQLHINARRNAYRAGFEPVVYCATSLLRELCAVIAAYAMAPLA